MRIPFICLSALLLSVASVHSQDRVHIDSLFSPSLGRIKPVRVLLPAEYDSSRRYPVLYLLHGLYGGSNDWLSNSRIVTFTKPLTMIIVLPDGENSWYVNSIIDSTARFEDYIMRDVMPWSRARYLIDTARQAIAGLSMGGYGAVYLAMRYPRSFIFAGSLSGGMSIPGEILEQIRAGESGTRLKSQVKAFGTAPGKFWDDHDPRKIYRLTPPDSLPYFYFVSGIQDGLKAFLPATRALTDSLRSYGAAYEYHEIPGEHNWIFWAREIQPLLRRLNEILQK